MKHFIIVKWKDPAAMKPELPVIEALFRETLSIPGIRSVDVYPSCSDRANRYDLMIEIGMDAEALPAYDACEPHRIWKERYGESIAQKAIFDCE